MVQNQYAIETDKALDNIKTEEVMNVEIKQSGIKESILKTAETVLGKAKIENRKEWIRKEIVEITEERQKYKNLSDEEVKSKYKSLRNKINRKSKLFKEKYLEEDCACLLYTSRCV